MDLLPKEESQGSERRLRRSDKRFLLACVLTAAVSLAIGFYLYPRVNPEASIRFDVTRPASEKIALNFLERTGVEAEGYRHAARFTFDDEAKVFLERVLGADAANRLLSGKVRMWRWGHRWFRPLQKEEFTVEVATTGQIAAFDHLLPEEAEGADLAQEEARRQAETWLSGSLGVPADSVEFLEARTEKRPHRTDHTFTWRRVGMDWKGGEYRYDVRIQGDRPGAFREYVHVPENWAREYASLRSKNTGAAVVASIFLVLTMLAMLAVLVLRIRLHDVRWRTAAVFAAIGSVLQILAGLNSLPVAFYEYDTTASYSGFLMTQLFAVFRNGVLLGVVIFFLTAAGEVLYREAFPEKISLTRFFTHRGLRTRRFLLSTVLGLTLTCFFFCYQEVFYYLARRLGAWAPMDVPYDDLLNTAFPWVFILLFGFFPAVTEEFLSRMFSIPFLRKLTRSTALAVILPAAIWGFGHSSYPNQPFFIRGLEVGLAGVVVGIVMLRFNILAALVWHFTVDALYTSYLLFRSENLYYIVSAALAGGILLVPLGYAIVSYLRRGEFFEPEGLLNRSEPGPTLPEPAEASGESGLPAMTEDPPGRGETDAGTPGAMVPVAFRGRRRVGLLLAGAIALLLLLIPAAELKLPGSLRLSREEAAERARAELRALGETPDSFRVVLLFATREDESEAKYLLREGGVARLQEEYALHVPPRFWSARFFRPLQTKEVHLSLDSGTGRLLAMERRIAEKDSLASLTGAEAESLARRFAAGQGIDLAALDLKDASEEKRPRRLDHSFTWEARAGDPRNAGEARHRVHVTVQGDRVGSFEQELKIPEDWLRERQKQTLLSVLRLILAITAGSAVLGLLLWLWITGLKAGLVRWRPVLLAAVPLALLALAAGINDWPRAVDRYDTTFPWNVFVIVLAAGLILRTLMGGLVAAGSLSLVTVAWPEAWALRRSSVRRRLLGDALLAAAAGLAVVLALNHLEGVLLRFWPSLAPVPSLSRPLGASSKLPWLSVMAMLANSTLLLTGLVAGVFALFRLRREYPVWAAALVVLCVVALVPLEAKSTGEFLVGLAWSAVQVAVALAVARWVLAGNLLATPLLIYMVVALRGVLPFLQGEGAFFRSNGVLAAVLLALPVLWLIGEAVAGRLAKSESKY